MARWNCCGDMPRPCAVSRWINRGAKLGCTIQSQAGPKVSRSCASGKKEPSDTVFRALTTPLGSGQTRSHPISLRRDHRHRKFVGPRALSRMAPARNIAGCRPETFPAASSSPLLARKRASKRWLFSRKVYHQTPGCRCLLPPGSAVPSW